MPTKLALIIGTCGRFFAVNPEHVLLISTIADQAGSRIEFDDGPPIVVGVDSGEVMRVFRREGATYFADFARIDGSRAVINLRQIRCVLGEPDTPTRIHMGLGEPIEVSVPHAVVFRTFLMAAGPA